MLHVVLSATLCRFWLWTLLTLSQLKLNKHRHEPINELINFIYQQHTDSKYIKEEMTLTNKNCLKTNIYFSVQTSVVIKLVKPCKLSRNLHKRFLKQGMLAANTTLSGGSLFNDANIRHTHKFKYRHQQTHHVTMWIKPAHSKHWNMSSRVIQKIMGAVIWKLQIYKLSCDVSYCKKSRMTTRKLCIKFSI